MTYFAYSPQCRNETPGTYDYLARQHETEICRFWEWSIAAGTKRLSGRYVEHMLNTFVRLDIWWQWMVVGGGMIQGRFTPRLTGSPVRDLVLRGDIWH